MSNKENLQNYNNTLSSIVDKVNSLPSANEWNGSTTINPSTQRVVIPVYSNKELTITPIKTYIDHIAITTLPTKVEYKNGKEGLDLTGMVVTCYYKDGSNRTVTNYTTNPAAGYIFTTDGTNSITVSYTEDDETVNASFNVTVKSITIVTWAGGTDEEIVEMVAAADRGEINLSDYWSVGQERQVSLSAMAATGVGESHPAQRVTFVLMHAGGKELNTPTASGRSTCSFIVGQKNGLTEEGYMNSYESTSGGWDGCKRRTWCNDIYYNAIPASLRSIFKQHKNITQESSGQYSSVITSIDWFALPAEMEVFGKRELSNNDEILRLKQFSYYTNAANRIKKGSAGYNRDWWERSPSVNNSGKFCDVTSGGSPFCDYSQYNRAIAPFGVI